MPLEEATMNQVIVGVFACYRDGHEALRALQLAGLSRDDTHLYRSGHDDVEIGAFPLPAHSEDDAEYVAHGEHQGVVGAHNRFVPNEPAARKIDDVPQLPEMRERTLLVIRISDDIKPASVSKVLHEHGAVAVKDPAGHWRFSPYRNAARV
jgi:hypothetical protein